MVCPTDALKEGSRLLGSLLTGYWYCGQSSMTNHSSEGSVINKSARGFKLTWGELRVGEAMSPPLIKQVKKMISCETRNIDTEQLNNQISIVDAPPGTSCPAVTTLRDSDFALLVAEETPFGLNDLALTVEALKKLHVPMGIVINRTDGEKGIIDNYADKENIEIMQRIPFSREAAKVCAKGLFLVDEIPEMKTLFQELYLKIINKVSRGRQQGEEIEERIKNNRRKTERGSENERANSDKW
jgi:MinD superfamily P-loop ATPase